MDAARAIAQVRDKRAMAKPAIPGCLALENSTRCQEFQSLSLNIGILNVYKNISYKWDKEHGHIMSPKYFVTLKKSDY